MLWEHTFVRSQGIRPGTSHCFTVITTSQPTDKRRTSLISGDLLPCIFNLQSYSYGKQTCHHCPVQFDVKQRRKRLGSNVCVFIVEASPLSASEFLFESPAEEDQSDHSEQNSVLALKSDSASDEAGPSASASKTNTPVRQCVK